MSSIPGTPVTSADTSQRDRGHPDPASATSGWTGWIVSAAVLLFLAVIYVVVHGGELETPS